MCRYFNLFFPLPSYTRTFIAFCSSNCVLYTHFDSIIISFILRFALLTQTKCPLSTLSNFHSSQPYIFVYSFHSVRFMTKFTNIVSPVSFLSSSYFTFAEVCQLSLKRVSSDNRVLCPCFVGDCVFYVYIKYIAYNVIARLIWCCCCFFQETELRRANVLLCRCRAICYTCINCYAPRQR